MAKRLTTAEFIEKAKKKHGNKYDYSKVEYINAKTKVCIICPVHGEFWQTPDKHLCGHSCYFCNDKRKMSRESYIERTTSVHGNKYDYSKVEYVNKDTKICVICHKKDENGVEHGEFYTTAHNHLYGCGCPKCSRKYHYSTDEIIEKFNTVHKYKYDYSKVNYINNKTKICIICPKHGEFYQTPYHHLDGSGCPKCNRSKLENRTEEILKEKNIVFEEQKRFDWLGLQSLDFYLPDYSIAIECQGEQHFKPVDFGGKGKKWAENLFKLNINRDIKKKNLCQAHKIRVEYIRFDEELRDKIDKILH